MKRLTCVALWSVVVVVVTGGTGWGATITVGTFEPAIAAVRQRRSSSPGYRSFARSPTRSDGQICLELPALSTTV